MLSDRRKITSGIGVPSQLVEVVAHAIEHRNGRWRGRRTVAPLGRSTFVDQSPDIPRHRQAEPSRFCNQLGTFPDRQPDIEVIAPRLLLAFSRTSAFSHAVVSDAFFTPRLLAVGGVTPLRRQTGANYSRPGDFSSRRASVFVKQKPIWLTVNASSQLPKRWFSMGCELASNAPGEDQRSENFFGDPDLIPRNSPSKYQISDVKSGHGGRLIAGRQICRHASDVLGAIKEYGASIGCQRGRLKDKVLYLLQETVIAAVGHAALRLAFRTSAVGAKMAKIAIAAGSQSEHIDLMVGNADAFGLIEPVQGLAAKPVEPGQILQARQPDRQVKILAFVPKLDPGAAIAAEAR